MNATIASITARGLFGRKRVFLLVPLPVILIGVALLCRAARAAASDWGPPVILGLGFGAVLPIIALVVGTGVLGSEIDDGTLVHILTKPLRRTEIVLAKLVVAVAVTTLITAVPMFVVGVIIGSVQLALALAVACLIGSAGYSALFLLLSLLSRRPVLIGLLYILIWENLLGRFVSGTGVLSIQQYLVTITGKLVDTEVLVKSHVSIGVAIVMSVVVLVGATAAAIDRLRSFSLTGETS
jgi:ABC-2 type transport system permease protein